MSMENNEAYKTEVDYATYPFNSKAYLYNFRTFQSQILSEEKTFCEKITSFLKIGSKYFLVGSENYD